MSRTRIHNLAISLDGFATREPQSTEAPFGHAGHRLYDWMFGTRFWARQGRARWRSGRGRSGSAWRWAPRPHRWLAQSFDRG